MWRLVKGRCLDLLGDLAGVGRGEFSRLIAKILGATDRGI